MSTIEQTSAFITNVLSVYIGSFLIIAGLIGNLINILIFTQLKPFRKNPPAFYLTVGSTADSFHLIFAVATRVITTASGFDPTLVFMVWCKLQIYFARIGSAISIVIVCFAAIDQYLCTSYHNRLRQISTLKLAQYLISILVTFVILYNISFPIFQELRPGVGCATFNPIFNYYASFVYLCILFGILPVLISLSSSLLAYQNVRRIVRRQISIIRRRLERQLTAMVLVRVVLMIITTLPFVIFRTYQINKLTLQNDTYTVAVENLIRTVILSINYVNYSGSFYLFLISSTRFCRQVKYFFVKKIWHKCRPTRVNRIQIAPENELEMAETHHSNEDIF